MNRNIRQTAPFKAAIPVMLIAALPGCSSTAAKHPNPTTDAQSKSDNRAAAEPAERPNEPPSTIAQLGAKAPDFTLKDLDGQQIRLSELAGKTVVLEWFNPDCPFVKLAHARDFSLKGKASEYAPKGVVWLAINSNAAGRQGHGLETNLAGRKALGIDYPILLDPTGEVGKRYGAERTPHMYVIDKHGTLVYNGAIDNTSGGDLDDAEPPPAVNHVDAALASVLSGGAVKTSQTTAWGCTVKYAE